ncbi:hypothetical protein LX36DRAFT_692090 [Colletotrichum falcatum]|nr:hypothetical protein LX36DRAFT_692090 [Colletotrichum falcatum]
MADTGFIAVSSKGKGFVVGFFLLVDVFLLGVAGAPSQPGGKIVLPIEQNWDPANPLLWSIRPEDRKLFAGGGQSSAQNRGTDAKAAGVTPPDYTWDPNNPPLWTVRPEDRDKFLGGTGASKVNDATMSNHKPAPCANKERTATLYQFLPPEEGMGFPDTCEKWNTESYGNYECTTFCQTSVKFEWAQEVPFAHSECHFPVSCGLSEDDSVTSGWNGGGSIKAQFVKALKIGADGGFSHSWSESEGRKFDVNLTEGQCGYFTFVPVKRIVCGGITEPAYPPRWYDLGSCKAGPKNTHLCVDQLWTVRNKKSPDLDFEITDGTVIFVYTDCFTRRPLPMNKQDPVYQAPGVAMHEDVLDGVRQSWVWNTCYLWNMGAKDKLSLYIHGSGFKDSMIGPEGKKLIERVSHCARSVDGVISDVEFTWYYSGYPGEDPKMTGAMWVFMADVPSNIRPGYLGDAMMELGGTTKDKCIGDKFQG